MAYSERKTTIVILMRRVSLFYRIYFAQTLSANRFALAVFHYWQHMLKSLEYFPIVTVLSVLEVSIKFIQYLMSDPRRVLKRTSIYVPTVRRKYVPT